MNVKTTFQIAIIVAGVMAAFVGYFRSLPPGIPSTAGNPSIQAAVASPNPLTTIGGGDPSVSHAADVNNVGAVSSDVGNSGVVKGTITSIIYPPKASDNITLYFATQDPASGAARALIPAKLFSQLPDLRNYLNRQVLISGNVTMGKRYPMIMPGSSNDIKLIQ